MDKILEKVPKISIVTPSLNQGRYIELTILSVLNQDYPNVEYIVIDGGSTDNTIEILKKYEEVLVWHSEADNGQSSTINQGFKIATGDILGWLNSDDMYQPGAFTTISEHFSSKPDIGMVYGKCNIIDEDDNHIRFYKSEPFSFKRYLNDADIVPQQSTFFKKCVVEKVGYLDSNLKYAMDLDFFVRIAKSYLLEYLPVHLASFRRYKGQKSSSGDERIYKDYYSEINKVISPEGAKQFNRRHLWQKMQTIRRYILKNMLPFDTFRYRTF